jgi:DNA invertase Pin-like site-specific DNA recombinase
MSKLQPSHLSRKAVLYIRQSSSYQVHHYTESRKLQYQMRHRLKELGFERIDVVDEDQGQTASGHVRRAGFEGMVADVCMGQVGAVAAREVSRFARNSRDWQQLVEVCRVVDTVLIDHDTIYSPRDSNDRLLLGLKGSLNEYELDILRLRSQEARRAKAKRGELLVSAPVGYEKQDGRLVKTPDLRVQRAIDLVFEKFLALSSVRQTLYWLLEEELMLPSIRHVDGVRQVRWARPRYSAVIRLLKNPAYGGIYAYGRTRIEQVFEDGQLRKRSRRVESDQWQVCLPNHHEGYVDHETFEHVQAMIAENVLTKNHSASTGPAKRGPALLSGLLRCRRCGRKLTVCYTGRSRNALRYTCCRGQLDTGDAKCISFSGSPLDEAIGREMLQALAPAGVAASQEAFRRQQADRASRREAVELELQEAQYQADRAFRQYDAADPENRLVTGQLETRWNEALEAVRRLEGRLAEMPETGEDSPSIPWEQFAALADRAGEVWQSPAVDVRLKKRLVRTLVEEVVVDLDPSGGWIEAIVHWKGGVHTELRLRRRRRGQSVEQAHPGTSATIEQLARICDDAMIANVLNRNGIRTGRGNRWTQERVRAFRTKRSIPKHNADRQDKQGDLNLTQAARMLGISTLPLRKAVQRGEIPALHPLPDGPWLFQRQDLESPSAQAAVERIKQRRRKGGLQLSGTLSLFESST